MRHTLIKIFFVIFISSMYSCGDQKKSAENAKTEDREINDTTSRDHKKPADSITYTGEKVIDTPSVIKSVLEKMDSIERISHALHGNKFFLEGLSTEGGEVEVTRNQDSVILSLYIKLFGETGRVFEKIYLNEQKHIICITSTDFSYNKPIYEKGSKISKIKKEYEIFYKGNLFAVLDKNKNKVSLDHEEMIQNDKSTKEELEAYFKQINEGKQ